MKFLLVICLISLMACSSSKKNEPKTFSQACMDVIKNTKIKAPRDIKYLGLYSNLSTDSTNKPQGHIIRIVKHHKDCSALILEYAGSTQPSKWTYSQKFECDLTNLTLIGRTGFKNPYKNFLPFVNDFTFKGYVLSNGDLMGAIIRDPIISPQKPEVEKIMLKTMPSDEFDMASFDWETIELMRLKSRCR